MKLLGWEDGIPSTQIRSLWGQDPVHLTTAAYKAMSEKVVEMLREDAPFINDPATTRDEIKKRSLWVQQDDATVPRRDSTRGKDWRSARGHSGGRGKHSGEKTRTDGRWRPYSKR